jgi:MobA/MobL family
MLRNHFHYDVGVVQRSKGQSAFAFAAYTSCTRFNAGHRRGDYRRDAGSHVGTVLLVPPEAPAKYGDEGTFLMELAAERRHDAQEGRCLTFAIPRDIPPELRPAVATFVIAHFARLGMVARMDIESPLASDGLPNPHAHVLLAQRSIDRLGFGNKQKVWDRLFRLHGGFHVRAIVAARLTLACAILGLPNHFDPRSNEKRGLPPAEPRLRRTLWKRQKAGETVPELEDLNRKRRARAAAAAKTSNDTGVSLSPGLTVSNVVSRDLSGENGEAAIEAMATFFTGLGIACCRENGGLRVEAGPGDTLLCLPDRIVANRKVSSDVAGIIVRCARAVDWSAVVAVGDQGSLDNLIVAGVPEEFAVVNRPASSQALSHIRRQYGNLLLRRTEVFDRSGSVARSLRLHQAARFRNALAYAPRLAEQVAAQNRRQIRTQFQNAFSYRPASSPRPPAITVTRHSASAGSDEAIRPKPQPSREQFVASLSYIPRFHNRLSVVRENEPSAATTTLVRPGPTGETVSALVQNQGEVNHPVEVTRGPESHPPGIPSSPDIQLMPEDKIRPEDVAASKLGLEFRAHHESEQERKRDAAQGIAERLRSAGQDPPKAKFGS